MKDVSPNGQSGATYSDVRDHFKELFPDSWGVACAAIDDVEGCMSWLKSCENVNFADSQGNTCLHHAIYNRNEELALAIIGAGFNAFEQEGRPSLSDSRRSGHYRDSPKTPFQFACSLELPCVIAALKPVSKIAYARREKLLIRSVPPTLPCCEDPSKGRSDDFSLNFKADHVVQPAWDEITKLADSIRDHAATLVAMCEQEDGRQAVGRWLHKTVAWLNDGFSTELEAVLNCVWPSIHELLKLFPDPSYWIMSFTCKGDTPAESDRLNQQWLNAWLVAKLPLPSPDYSPHVLSLALERDNFPLATALVTKSHFSLTESHVLPKRDNCRSNGELWCKQDELTALAQNRYATPWLLKLIRSGHLELPNRIMTPDECFWLANPYLWVWLWNHAEEGLKAAFDECFCIGMFHSLEAHELYQIAAHWVTPEQGAEAIEKALEAYVPNYMETHKLLSLRPEIINGNENRFWDAAMRSEHRLELGAIPLVVRNIAPPTSKYARTILRKLEDNNLDIPAIAERETGMPAVDFVKFIKQQAAKSINFYQPPKKVLEIKVGGYGNYIWRNMNASQYRMRDMAYYLSDNAAYIASNEFASSFIKDLHMCAAIWIVLYGEGGEQFTTIWGELQSPAPSICLLDAADDGHYSYHVEGAIVNFLLAQSCLLPMGMLMVTEQTTGLWSMTVLPDDIPQMDWEDWSGLLARFEEMFKSGIHHSDLRFIRQAVAWLQRGGRIKGGVCSKLRPEYV
ncbi:TPA: hypothetical protein RQN23_000818 [Aeromonas veronii]|nr:hypothetical protein [Aeromonas veronii]